MAAKEKDEKADKSAPLKRLHRGSISKNVFHMGLEPYSLKGSFRSFQKADFSLTEKCNVEPFRRRKQIDPDSNKDSTSANSRTQGLTLGGTSVHSIFIESADEDLPINFDPREFLSRACERSSMMTNTDPQLVLRLESACVTQGAQDVLEQLFWVVYLKSFQRKSEALLEQFQTRLMRAWVNFFANVPTPKEPVVDRFCPILVESLMFIFTEAFPKSKSLVVDHGFGVYVYRCVYRQLLGVSLASVTVDRLRSSHIGAKDQRDLEPGSMLQAPPSPEFTPFYHRDAYISGDEGAIASKHLWWDPEEDPIWEDDARKLAIRQRAAAEAGIATSDQLSLTRTATSATINDMFLTTLVSPAVSSMSKRKNLHLQSDPGRRVRVGEVVRRPVVDLRIQPRRQRPVTQDGAGIKGMGISGKEPSQASVGESSPTASTLNRCGTSPAALQASPKNNKGTTTGSQVSQQNEADMFSRVHRLVLAETYAKKSEAKERERFLPPKYMPLEMELRETMKARKEQKEEYERQQAQKARLLEGRRGAVKSGQSGSSAVANFRQSLQAFQGELDKGDQETRASLAS